MSSRRQGAAALTLAAVLWSTTFVVTKPLLESMPPLTLALARFMIASLVLLPLVVSGRQALPGWTTLMLLGLFGVTGFYACFNFGLALTSASQAALIQGAGPALTALVSRGVLGERLTLLGWSGLALSAVGVALIVLRSAAASEAVAPLLGDTLLVASLLCWAFYTVQFKRLAVYPALPLTAAGTLAGTLLLLPLAAGELLVQGIPDISGASWLWVIYLALGPSAAAYLLWTRGVQAVSASQAGAFLNLIPVFGVTLAAVLLGEQPALTDLFGGSLVIAGVWLTSHAREAGA
jgi:drug/metabolite transporter (DMT)-like permease